MTDGAFAIITPTLGRSPWLREALRDTEVMGKRVVRRVVAPEAKVAELRLLIGPIPVVSEVEAGLYAAVNEGFRAAGDWRVGTYLNDDDRLIPQGVATALCRLERDPRIGGVFGRVRLIDREGRAFAEIPVARRAEDLGPLLCAGVVPLAQPGTIFRREMFEELGGFDTCWRAAGDLDFFFRAWRAGWRFSFVDACVAEFRVHPAQISRCANLVEKEKRRLVAVARGEVNWRREAFRAKWRFRCANIGLYLARLRRPWMFSMERLQRRANS